MSNLDWKERIEADFGNHKAGEKEIELMAETRARFADLATFVAGTMTGNRVVDEVLSLLQTAMFKVNANIVKGCEIVGADVVLKNLPPEREPVVGVISRPAKAPKVEEVKINIEVAEGDLDLTKKSFNKQERATIKDELTARGVEFDQSQRSTALAKKLLTARLEGGMDAVATPVMKSSVQEQHVAASKPVDGAPVIGAPLPPANPEPIVATPEPQATPEVAPPAPTAAAPKIEAPATATTLEETQATIKTFYNTMGEAKTIELLGYFGAQNVSSLQPVSYKAIIQKANEIMQQAKAATAGVLA